VNERLPSWRPGATRDAILGYLDGVGDIPVEDRVAYFDNDGTLWCERPSYVQFDFFVDELRRRSAEDPSVAERPEFDAVLRADTVAMGELGLERVALALAGMFDGMTPEEFAESVDGFAARYRHSRLGAPLGGVVYQPMLELLAELRAAGFTIGIVTGGGTEFVRRVSPALYGVAPEMVVGTLIGYQFTRDGAGRPMLRRTVERVSSANEGATKVGNIQTQLGRPPIVAGGNSAGDREMLEWALAGRYRGLAILVDHDDADREFAYQSTAVAFEDAEPITEVAERLGWVTVSMARDWATVFPVT
jgi:phosphoserine phosphatase